MLRRGQKRKADVELSRAAVGSAARGRYDTAITRFKIFPKFFGLLFAVTDLFETDRNSAAYIQTLYDQGLPMTWTGDFLSAMADRWLALRGNLSASRRNFSAWKRLEPSCAPSRRRGLFYAGGCTAFNVDHVVLPTLVDIGRMFRYPHRMWISEGC